MCVRDEDQGIYKRINNRDVSAPRDELSAGKLPRSLSRISVGIMSSLKKTKTLKFPGLFTDRFLVMRK